ncbi:MAG: hypothetical protein ABSF53_21355 [Terracidiphilus sp.]|jgi:hypothetical protein
MGISPISNLLPLAVESAGRADRESLPMQRVENSARSGDETYSHGDGKPAADSEEDANQTVMEADSSETDEEPVSQQADSSTGMPLPGGISFFA